MKSFRNIRVIPVVVVAICCLAVLKVAGLVIDGGYVFEYNSKRAAPSWAQENINYPGSAKVASATAGDPSDITGSAHGAAPKKKEEEKPKVEAPDTKPEGVVLHPEENQPPVSASERAILERLQSRRQELDARARELDLRETLMKGGAARESPANSLFGDHVMCFPHALEADSPLRAYFTISGGAEPAPALLYDPEVVPGVDQSTVRAGQNLSVQAPDGRAGCRAGRGGGPVPRATGSPGPRRVRRR